MAGDGGAKAEKIRAAMELDSRLAWGQRTVSPDRAHTSVAAQGHVVDVGEALWRGLARRRGRVGNDDRWAELGKRERSGSQKECNALS